MLKKYFLIGLRSILNQRFYSILNIVGLGVGLALVIFIGLYLHDQHRFDRWYADHERIYRVEYGEWGITGPAFKRVIEESSAAIEQSLRLNTNVFHNTAVRRENEIVRIRNLVAADPEVFDFFDLTFIHGDAATALDDIGKIVLTRSEALRLFNTENPIGEVLSPRDEYNLVVSAVIEDISHFHVRVDALVSFFIFGQYYGTDYFELPGNWNHNTYVKLHPEADPGQVRQQVEESTNNYIYETAGIAFDRKTRLRPVSDIYYTTESMVEGRVVHGNKSLSIAFMVIAAFVLFIAVVNFINLSTAHSTSRAREMGIRKLLGGTRNSLMVQFLLESIIITAAGMLLAVALVEIFLPSFNTLAGVNINLREWSLGWHLLTFIVAALIVGTINGIYPAFYLSGFEPARVLKGELTKGKSAAFFRKGLMAFQFATAITLIAGTFIVYQQIHYMQSKDLNFNPENIVFFRANQPVLQRWDEFRNTLQSSPGIEEVALTNSMPGSVGWQESVYLGGQIRQFYYWPATPEFFTMLGAELLAGRWPDRALSTDQHYNMVVNRQWLHLMGLDQEHEDIIDQSIPWGTGRITIIGIVSDFHFNSLHSAIAPMAFVWREESCRMVSIKLHPHNQTQTLEHISKTWLQFYPDEPLNWHYLDETLMAQYSKEEQTGTILTFFSLFAIFIACLGLFGLSSFLIEKRSKEIALRKVLGSPLLRIHILLQKEFITLIAVASLIAIPLGWYFMSSWLDGFPYRIQMGVVPFFLAVVLTLFIAMATVSWHAIRVSGRNPSDFLRAE
ncbi:MAG: ABC transporter permease [Bacteroidetes bacterium]|nr:MAG: ABC transporter permease [Bacteroidota bacterium]